jgi:isopenicillin N synthase-like dioxygenase
MQMTESKREITICDMSDFLSNDVHKQQRFVSRMGYALKDIGFFALTNHGIPLPEITLAYSESEKFFSLGHEVKSGYEKRAINRQRGFTSFGIEHAKGNDAPDLKEFWQTGRTLSPDHKNFETYPENIWPIKECPEFEGAIDGLYLKMESLSRKLLNAASLYLGREESWLSNMAIDGNTIMRMIHYPEISDDADPASVRSAEHEDINLITLLVGASADGLQVMDHDGSWISVAANHDHIIVDSGDMLQNITNGLFKSTTHRVINPDDSRDARYSMPMFVHPRDEVDLTPDPDFVALTGGVPLYESITAGEYLLQRLREIGLTS